MPHRTGSTLLLKYFVSNRKGPGLIILIGRGEGQDGGMRGWESDSLDREQGEPAGIQVSVIHKRRPSTGGRKQDGCR